MQAEKPIGYCIKQADERLTKGINETLAFCNVTRTKWQILNSLYESTSLNKSNLTAMMAPFADAEATAEILETFQQEEIILITQDNLFTLTEKGKVLHKLCFEQQQLFRQKAMTGITAEDYRTTMQTLEKIAGNLQL